MKKNPINFLISLLLFIIAIITFGIIFGISIKDLTKNEELSKALINNTTNTSIAFSVQNNTIIEDKTLSISVIGDIMCHNTQFKDAYSNGQYNFSYVFSDIKNYIEKADISIGNLETTFAGRDKIYSGYPQFNTPEALAYSLKELGIDILTTANNHSLDTGYSGIESTIKFLDEAQLSHTGTFTSFETQNTILYKEVNGIKIAFLAYTYGTNGIPIPYEKEYCINLINKDLILSHLNIAKSKNPDIICVSIHWGEEYQTTPNSSQKDLTNFLFENGADIILGSHPHVLQPFEKREITLSNGTKKDGFVIYSLGNFMSGQIKENTRNSIILNLNLTKHANSNKISIDNISYIPIYLYTYPKYKNYKILDIEKTLYNYENGINTNLPNNPSSILKTELHQLKSILDSKNE